MYFVFEHPNEMDYDKRMNERHKIKPKNKQTTTAATSTAAAAAAITTE